MDTSRFRAVTRTWGRKRVMVVGVGGIGSYVVPPLIRMGLENVALVDYDTVELANVGTQDVHWSDGLAERTKVQVVGERARRISEDVDIRTWCEAWNVGMLEEFNPHVLILSVDSIEAREEIVTATLTSPKRNLELIIDPRMGFEALEVYTWTPKDHRRDVKQYLATLKERDHSAVRCGASAIAYTGQYAGAVVASVVRRWLCGVTIPQLILADMGSYEMNVTWKVNEQYVECVV